MGGRAVFVPIVPCRIMDTRTDTNVGTRSTPIGAAETHTIPVLGVNGQCTIPMDATGLVMNVTGINATVGTYLTVFPSGSPTPNASNLNLVAGQSPTPNAVTVDVPADGKVSFFNSGGTLDVAADIVGYYVDHDFDDRYYTKAQSDDRYYTKAQNDDRNYTKAQVGSRSMFAVVNGNGTLRRGTAGVTSTLAVVGGFAGDFFVTFPRDITPCGYVGSTSSVGGEGSNQPAGTSV